MPVVSLDKNRLEELIGENIEFILEKIPMIGADIEREEEKEVDIEFFPNRPDLFSAEGVARAMRGFLGKERGLLQYNMKKSNVVLEIDESVKGVRPEIVGAVVKNLEFNEKKLASIVNLQEHLHWGLGRNRKKVSIGLHDLENIEPPFTYKATYPSETEFVPLNHREKMNLKEILEKHKKGKEYGDIIKRKDKYPVIKDNKGDILSFPPIINGVLTEVTESTKEVFIDVTGTDEKGVNKALNILTTALAEIGGEIHQVKNVGLKNQKTPQLSPKTKKVSLEEVEELSGISLSEKEVKDSLEKMRYDVELEHGSLKVKVPAYRSDILHPWDIIEDVAIGYGYDSIEPTIPNVQGIGETHPIEKLGQQFRDIMTGLGYQEIMTLTLTNEKKEFRKVNRKKRESVEIKNPISEKHTIFRSSLLPSLLEILEINQHRDLPQKIFEFGEVEHLKKEFSTDCYHLGVLSLNSEAGFTEAKSLFETIFNEIDLEYFLQESDDDLFLEGRRADIFFEEEKIGVFGEISPTVLNRFDLENPCIGLELEIEKFI